MRRALFSLLLAFIVLRTKRQDDEGEQERKQNTSHGGLRRLGERGIEQESGGKGEREI